MADLFPTKWPCRLLLAAVLAACGLPALAARDGERVPVGTVTLLIGDARVVRPDGTQSALRHGGEVFVGDRVETGANGHVHLAFVDRAAVSVRPDSALEVQSYRYDPQRPEANEVRLRVERGTARSISGDALAVDKSRFRLNTPIAAIGVRGTDFIVQSAPGAVRAVVAEGAISVSPLGSGCSSEALGPCTGAGARQLTALMGRTMVEVRDGDRVARLAPAVHALLPVAHLTARGQGAREEGSTLTEAFARAEALGAASPSVDSRIRNNDRSAADVLGISPLAAKDSQALRAPPDPAAQLAWGRWTFSAPAFDGISLAFAQASSKRHVTVGDADGALFRYGARPDPAMLAATANTGYLNPALGRFDLQLSRAQATFSIGDRTEDAAVTAGVLSLDFGARSFASALSLSSATGGAAELRVAGQVQPDGVFNVRDNEQRVSGAVTSDGKEAGYLFERLTRDGAFRGRTLWGRP